MIDISREQEVMPEPPAHVLIRVTNRNSFTIRDRFDGVPVTFKPNETVTINRDQAAHFFGYPGDPRDRAVHMAKRYGWNTTEHVRVDPLDGPDGPTLYQKYAWNVVFEEQEFELVPKSQQKADDGLKEVDDLPKGAAPPTPDMHDAGTSRVGRRTGSTAKPHRRTGRPPGRPRKYPLPPERVPDLSELESDPALKGT
jgi:hypothetical protein